MKKHLCLLLALLMLTVTVFSVGCSNNNSATPDEGGADNSTSTETSDNVPNGGVNEDGTTDYAITVTDANGAAYTGCIVRFSKDGAEVAMQVCDENGVATKNLPTATYQLSVSFTDGDENYYYESPVTIEAGSYAATIIVSRRAGAEPQTIVTGDTQYNAYSVSVGSTYVNLEAGKLNYFLFTPASAGKYQFSVYNNNDAKIGYYGAPHYIQSNSVVEVIDNKFTVSVSASMIGDGTGGTSVLVLGVESTNNTENCVICISRIGDPDKTIEDEPWNVYQPTVDIAPYVLPEDAEIKEFDLTASTETYNIVFNEADGFYHLNSADGPLVLVRLAEDCDYIACFATILDRSGVNRYYYNENGDFEKKVDFSGCLLQYIDCADENYGVYPLTEDLKHIITERGEYVGWWNPTSNSYIFKDDNGANDLTINTEIAWLLMCCYAE